jgi:hypothetical protein
MTSNNGYETRELGTLVWHSSPSNLRDWMASDEYMCHTIVQFPNGEAMLNSTKATAPMHVLPGLRCGSFTQAASAAVQRSAAEADNYQAPQQLPTAAQHLADCSTTPGGDHWYLSTSCYHGMREDDPAVAQDLHGHCAGSVNHAGETKVAGSCKRCPAQCVCECHTRQEQEARQ